MEEERDGVNIARLPIDEKLASHCSMGNFFTRQDGRAPNTSQREATEK
jgi:hypothetical protein